MAAWWTNATRVPPRRSLKRAPVFRRSWHSSSESSSSATSAPPVPLKGGMSTLYRAFTRVVDRAPELAELKQQYGLFNAGAHPPEIWWMLLHLHMPARTDVDLPEFLQGVKVAAEAQLRAVNSREFAEFAAGWKAQSAVADELTHFCSPRFFEQIKRAAATTLKMRNMTLELQDIDVAHAEVTGVKYAQLTEAQYEAQMAGLPCVPTFWAPDATVEYLQVEVTTRSTETTKMTLLGQEECVARQDNTRVWVFGSRVDSPEELEWRIIDTVAMNNAAKQLSRTVLNADRARKAEEQSRGRGKK